VQDDASYWVTVRLPAYLLADIAYMEHQVVDAEQCVARINFGSAGDAAWRLFAWRDEAEVLEPQEFIDSLVARSRRIVERYAERASAQTADLSLTD
jgi:predicted DNA-binding transcriptional regulator YafY